MFRPAIFIQQLDKKEQKHVFTGWVRTYFSPVGLVNDIIHFQKKATQFVQDNVPLPGMTGTFHVTFNPQQAIFQ